MNNEQPMRADLFEAPMPGDVGLRCTNLRMMNDKRPIFIDDTASIFFFPYLHVRFVEIPRGAVTGSDPAMALVLANSPVTVSSQGSEPGPEADLQIDEDFLRRVREA